MGGVRIKIDRLVGILVILLQKEKVTAPELAARFEVSRRTINRDIEDLCKAGVPVVTMQGANGGITIMDDYKIEKTLFSDKELRSILLGLSSLDSVTKSTKYQTIIQKFTANKNSLLLKNNIMIDLSSHHKDTLAPKIELLQSCIDQNQKVSFLYCNHKGERTVIADPYLIVFQWSNWYFLGLDNASNEFKLYKLNRICNMNPLAEFFDLLEIPENKLDFGSFFTDEIPVEILFDPSEKYRLIEEYGVDCYVERPDGKLLFTSNFTTQHFLLSWVLSFGDKAQLIKPEYLRLRIREQINSLSQKYTNDDI